MFGKITVRYACPLAALALGTAAVSAQAADGEVSLQPSGAFTRHQNGPSLPVMGWNPWNAFRTDVDETKILRAAQRLVDSGLAARGYRYVDIDDGWWLRRGADGVIQIRTGMFPSARLSDGKTSLRPFTDRLHAMGLKAGIYTDIGRNACSQRWDPKSPNLPEGTVGEREIGSMDFQRQDVTSMFGTWGFDLIKVDACGLADFAPGDALVRNGQYRAFGPLIVRGDPVNSDRSRIEALYASLAANIRQVRPGDNYVLSICTWGEGSVRSWGKKYGTMWRTSPDMQPRWESMLLNFDSAAPWTLFAGPGHWNDPDMLAIGLGDFDKDHLTEARAHLSMWAILSAPLLLGYDLTRSPKELIELVGNPEVIAIDQDPAGNAGAIVSQTADITIVAKTLTGNGIRAVALINRTGKPVNAGISLDRIGLTSGAAVRDLWQHRDLGRAGATLSFALAPHETKLIRLTGRPLRDGRMFLGEMPSRINVAVDGTERLSRPLPKDWVPARVDFTPAGKPLTDLRGRPVHGIGVLANSRLEARMDGEYRVLRLRPAILSRNPGDKPVVFRVYGDGRLLSETLLSRGRPDTPSLAIDIAGVRTIELVTAGGALADGPAMAGWIDAAVE